MEDWDELTARVRLWIPDLAQGVPAARLRRHVDKLVTASGPSGCFWHWGSGFPLKALRRFRLPGAKQNSRISLANLGHKESDSTTCLASLTYPLHVDISCLLISSAGCQEPVVLCIILHLLCLTGIYKWVAVGETHPLSWCIERACCNPSEVTGEVSGRFGKAWYMQ